MVFVDNLHGLSIVGTAGLNGSWGCVFLEGVKRKKDGSNGGEEEAREDIMEHALDAGVTGRC